MVYPRPRIITEKDERRFALYSLGLIDRMIGEAEGVDHTSIYQWRRLRGLPPNDSLYIRFLYANASKKDLERERLQLIADGFTDGEIARRQGRDRSSIRCFRKAHGLPKAPLREKPRKNYNQRQQYTRISYEACFGETHIADPGWSSWLEEMGATVF